MNNTPSEKRMPAAQHEGAVESAKTAGGTGGADLRGTGAGSPVQVGDSLEGKLRKAMERKMHAVSSNAAGARGIRWWAWLRGSLSR